MKRRDWMTKARLLEELELRDEQVVRARRQMHKARRKAKGLCADCGNPAAPMMSRCEPCRALHREREAFCAKHGRLAKAEVKELWDSELERRKRTGS